jgi:hypothetical protein
VENFSANSIIKNLDTWLDKYSIGGNNHVLNGILYEIYFNSKGQFRQKDFKCDFIDQIFTLQTNDKYKISFEFIRKQLSPFREFLFYIPENPAKPLAIEIKVEPYKYKDFNDKEEVGHRVISVKHEEIELMSPLRQYRL